ncbi:MAG: NADH-quinone oxidoreductase subunit L [Candidatus Kapaibacteriales bacterium]
MHELIYLVPLLPLLGFILVGLFGSYIKNEKIVGALTSATVLGGFVIALLTFLEISADKPTEPYIVDIFDWISTGYVDFSISYQVDQLSIMFTMIITGIGFLIHLYSIGYMHGDRSFYRFFAYLNLFVFMMLNLVLADNFLLTFFGWEGVGLASYLLIGFWYNQKFDGYRITWTGDAANKAFIVNRIGDFGFLLAMFLIFMNFGTLDYYGVQNLAVAYSSELGGGMLLTGITLLIFLACTGKSAQLPLAGWLPDAMAGPTSVSALIHAATMVTAGIFLIARNATLFALTPDTMLTVAVIGAVTAILAASIGLVQNDIKKVLAYSTVSQLGFMFAALGVGAWTAALFHVMTHAFFKGLMFLGAGSVIHGMHHEQDIKKMGGLKKHMPTTYWTFLIGTLAISGIPFFSGFFSKDEILWLTFSSEYGGWWLWAILAVAAFFTAFYMFRLLFLTFHGKERFDVDHVKPHESPATMTIPLVVLAILSAVGGFVGVPYALGFFVSDHPNLLHSYLMPIFAKADSILGIEPHHEVHAIEYILMTLSTVVAIVAIFIAKKMYSDPELKTATNLSTKYKGAYNTLWNKWYLDEGYYKGFVTPIYRFSKNFLWKLFDVKFVDGIVNGSGKLTKNIGGLLKGLQSGVAQNYAVLMMFGIVIIIILMMSHL